MPADRPLARALVLLASLLPAVAQAQTDDVLVATSQAGPLRVETVADKLENPWGLAFLPDGRLLVTERAGRLRILTTSGTLSNPVRGVPPVLAEGQGGLLDVTLSPDFTETRLVYLSYAEPREGVSGTTVARGKLVEDAGDARLDNVEVIFRQQPSVGGTNHYGSRLVFGRDGNLFVTLGDRYSQRDKAQDLTTHLGKIVRIAPDGSVPGDNPFVNLGNARPEIWSYGHRNVQAAAINPATGQLWTAEHGARGGDEVNHPEAGKNYGWPIITYGRDYSGASIGEGTEKTGMEQPLKYWDPSIAPSGMAFYTGTLFPKWQGSVFVGALAGSVLVRLSLDGDRITGEERLLESMGQRIRDVQQGPDGALWLLTDDPTDGRVLRVVPG